MCTQLVSSAAISRRRPLEAETPLGRIGQPQDIASVAAFLAGRTILTWVNGETIEVAGGKSSVRGCVQLFAFLIIGTIHTQGPSEGGPRTV